MTDIDNAGVRCGDCDGEIEFLVCGQGGCSWVVGSYCHGCGRTLAEQHPDEPCNTDNAGLIPEEAK